MAWYRENHKEKMPRSPEAPKNACFVVVARICFTLLLLLFLFLMCNLYHWSVRRVWKLKFVCSMCVRLTPISVMPEKIVFVVINMSGLFLFLFFSFHLFSVYFFYMKHEFPISRWERSANLHFEEIEMCDFFPVWITKFGYHRQIRA